MRKRARQTKIPQPKLPPANVPLNETFAIIHYEGVAEDYDANDYAAMEARARPVNAIVSVPLTPDEARLLNELAEREGTDGIGTMRAALHEYAARRSQSAAS